MANLNDVAKRYYETQLAAGSTTTESAGDLGSGRLLAFEREVLSTYGSQVSISDKAKSLRKFGRNGTVDTALETIWTPGGNEVYCTTNAITHFSSSSGSDTQQIIIEGHTVTGTGASAVFTFSVQTVTLSGQTKVALTTPLARVSRAYNDDSTDLVGNIYVYEDDTVTAGVPQTANKLHLQIPAGSNKSFKASTTFSNNDYFALTGMYASVTKSSGNAAVDFFLEVRFVGKTFTVKEQMTITAGSAGVELFFDPVIVIPQNADVRIRAVATATNIPCAATFEGYIASVTT